MRAVATTAEPPVVIACRVFGERSIQFVEFDAAADLDAAMMWRSSMRRIVRVEIERHASGWRCCLVGVGHRLPTRRPVPLRIALGLAQLGTPAFVRREITPW